MCGCDAEPDGRIRQFMKQAYDGEDFFHLNEQSSWTYRDPSAWKTQNRWNKTFEKDNWKACMLNHLCHYWLPKFLEKGKATLQRAEPPKTHLTHHPISEYETRLKCWALGFYPEEITLTWKRDGDDQNLGMELLETRPAGDGTYQKCAAVIVPSGEEHRYTCCVQHQELPKPLTLRWELPGTSNVGIVIALFLLGVVVFGALVIGAMTWRKKCSGRGGNDQLY
ncbi:class I histocompatibility antigen, Gogo-OKO alpha chain-like [Rhynchocyon petersi]